VALPLERYGLIVGNFPQAFTHVALVSTALTLARDELSPPAERAEAA
jgi:hypothetical protein